MIKLNLTLVALLFLSMANVATAQSYTWAKNAVSNQSDGVFPTSLTIDAAGNVYNAGYMESTADLDPSATVYNLTVNTSGADAFIQKLDANGNFVWAKQLRGTDAFLDYIQVKVDASGNVYVSGIFDDAVDFDPSVAVNIVSPQGFLDGFLLKLDASGNFVWVKTYGVANEAVELTSLALDNANNIILGGNFSGSIDFDVSASTQILTAINSDGFVLKLDATGGFTFVKQLVASSYVSIASIDIDVTNNIYLGGIFIDALDIDPGPGVTNVNSASNSSSLYFLRLNQSGNFVFGNSFAGGGDASIASLKVDNAQHLIIAGTYYEACDMDPSAATSFLPQPLNNAGNGYILKLDNLGAYQWVKQFVNDDDMVLSGLDVDLANNIYTAGYFIGTIDLDPGIAVNNINNPGGDYDIFVSKLNASGNYSFGHAFGSNNNEGAFTIEVDDANNIYANGLFGSAIDFDPSAVNNTLASVGEDIFCFKWGQCTPDITNLSATGCSYTLNGQTYTGNGLYTQYYTSASGCDSIVNLTLTGSSTNTNLSAIVCGTTYTYNGITYSSSGVYTQNYTNSAGCDSNTIINLNIGTATSSTLNETTCDFYVFNNNFLFNTGTYTDTLPNASGCDSIITLNLVVNQSTSSYLQVNTCGPYTFDGILYTTSGMYNIFYTAANGCDSTINLDLIIVPIQPTNIFQNSCNPYTWYGQTYSVSGTYDHLLTSAAGCDSLLKLNLTITTPNVNVTKAGDKLTSSASGNVTYQWIKCNPYSIINGANSQTYTATVNGSYAVIVTQNGCIDTSLCTVVTGVNITNYFSNDEVKVYPNPVSEVVNIEFSELQANVRVKIQSLVGQTISENEYFKTKRISQSLHDLAKGIYFVQISNGVQMSLIKVMKE
jgi:hypothetical protein